MHEEMSSYDEEMSLVRSLGACLGVPFEAPAFVEELLQDPELKHELSTIWQRRSAEVHSALRQRVRDWRAKEEEFEQLRMAEKAKEKGHEAKGEKAKGKSAKGDEAKGDKARGDEAKGDEAKGDEAKGDEAKTHEELSKSREVECGSEFEELYEQVQEVEGEASEKSA